MKSDEIINFKDEVISDWLMEFQSRKSKKVCCQNIGIQNFGIIDFVLLRISIWIFRWLIGFRFFNYVHVDPALNAHMDLVLILTKSCWWN